jgi:glutathione S-transferase
MIKLYDNPFSPFARKVRMVLAHKEIPFQSIDALAKEHHGALVRANPRAEVPALDDDGFIVSNSSEIVAYLEDRQPDPRVFPSAPRQRAKARSRHRGSGRRRDTGRGSPTRSSIP